jgi:methionine biosynthesis protein MetW
MLYFVGTRKPNFKNVSKNIYSDYWKETGLQLRGRLMAREMIFFDWIMSGSNVLSLGCGNSRLLFELKNKKACQVLGVDIENSVVEGQKKEGVDAIQIDLTDKNLDLEKMLAKKFDYIVASELLEHLAMPEELIMKLKNLTNNLIISVPNSAFYRYRVGLMFGGRFFTQWAKHPAEHLRFWSYLDFLDWLDALGLGVVKVSASNGPGLLRDFWPNMFGHQICYLVSTKKL